MRRKFIPTEDVSQKYLLSTQGIGITTSSHSYQPISWDELTKKEKKELNYPGSEEDSFYRYRGLIYPLGDFIHWGQHGYDGIHNDSAFSGVAVKVDENGNARFAKIVQICLESAIKFGYSIPKHLNITNP